jgi:RNA recognition motif-containing protein
MRPIVKVSFDGVWIVREQAGFLLQKSLLYFFEHPSEPDPSTGKPFPEVNSLSTLLLKVSGYTKRLRINIIMSMKLYVGNLSFQTSNYDLEEMFGQVGTVESARIIEDRETGRSRGFAFVEMSSTEEGQNAIDQFNGKDLNGRNLNVNEARPREDRGGNGGGNRGGFGGGNNRGGSNRGGGYGGGSRW